MYLASVYTSILEIDKMLRCVVLLCFCLIAARRSFADICDPIDPIDLIAQTFAKTADDFPVPSFEKCDYWADDFKKAYIHQIVVYGRSLAMNVYGQARTEGEVLTDAIYDLANELQWAIQTMRTNQTVDKICIEEIMNEIIQQFETFLELLPGPWAPLQRKLPNSPTLKITIRSSETIVSPHNLFVNYNATLNEITAAIYEYATTVLFTGWQATRPYYENFGLQIRNEILNDKVLDVYKRVASQINMEYDFIEVNIEPALWESYKRVANRIFEAWNAYQLCKNHVTCM